MRLPNPSSTTHPETDGTGAPPTSAGSPGTAHIVYGPLALGAQVMYEGTPTPPHQGRWWEIVQKYGVTVLYTAPTAIRT